MSRYLNEKGKLLLKTLEILDSKEAWTKGSFAKDVNGKTVAIQSQEACKFCMVGALDRADGGKFSSNYHEARTAILSAIEKSARTRMTIPSFNDKGQRQHKDVIEVLTTAAFLALADAA